MRAREDVDASRGRDAGYDELEEEEEEEEEEELEEEEEEDEGGRFDGSDGGGSWVTTVSDGTDRVSRRQESVSSQVSADQASWISSAGSGGITESREHAVETSGLRDRAGERPHSRVDGYDGYNGSRAPAAMGRSAHAFQPAASVTSVTSGGSRHDSYNGSRARAAMASSSSALSTEGAERERDGPRGRYLQEGVARGEPRPREQPRLAPLDAAKGPERPRSVESASDSRQV